MLDVDLIKYINQNNNENVLEEVYKSLIFNIIVEEEKNIFINFYLYNSKKQIK